MTNLILILVFIALLIFVVGITAIVIKADEKEHQKARENGCICTRTPLVIWERSDCPYCSSKRK